MKRDRRRLTAIVSADVAGYARLMGEDESGTLAALRAHVDELILPRVKDHDGRIVKSMGDGFLLEFPSVVEALLWALDLQRGMAARNAAVAEDRRIEFRVGINLGDIIIEGEDIFGDGVNIAARLQALAEPGGICVSRGVRDQVLDKVRCSFTALGMQTVKNIARPIEVYRVGAADGNVLASGARVVRAARVVGWRLPAIVAGIALVALVGWFALGPMREAERSAPALSLAVLPFTAPGGTVGDVAMADAITRGLTATLGDWRFAAVTPYAAAAAYRDKANDVRAVGHALNVRYLAGGEVTRLGNEFAVNAQLIDAAAGTQVWSGRIVHPGEQDRSDVSGVVVALNGRIRDALMRTEQHRVSAEGNVPGATPADVVLRGRSVETTASDPATGILDAGKLYDQALRLDPSYVPALVARIDNLDRLIYATRPGREERDRIVSTMDELSRRAIAVDESYAGAWYARALALYWQGRMQEALEANARYDRLLPTRALPLNQRAWFMLASGRAEEAVALVDQALARPSKGAPEESFALATRCAIDVRLARYDDAIADCRKAMTVQNYDFADMLLLAAYAQKGDMNDAAAVKERVLKRRPDVSISSEREMLTSSNPVFLEQTEQNFFEGLRKAGIREQ